VVQGASQSFGSVGRPMHCSKCGTNNPPANNFCAKCGNALTKPCTKCKAENPPTSDFCGKCGAPLTNGAGAAAATSSPQTSPSNVRVASETSFPEAPDDERKMVTALFADIKGSTELIERLDPEEARAIVDPALKLMMEAVHRYSGYVAQSTGNEIFGLSAPTRNVEESSATVIGWRRIRALPPLLGRCQRRGNDRSQNQLR
jgi:ribosomal protein L40E